jgi:hypothetical protein
MGTFGAILAVAVYSIIATVVFVLCRLTGPNGISELKSLAIAATWPVSLPGWYVLDKIFDEWGRHLP